MGIFLSKFEKLTLVSEKAPKFKDFVVFTWHVNLYLFCGNESKTNSTVQAIHDILT